MLLSLTLVAPDFDTLQLALPAALEAVAGAGEPVKDTALLGEGAADILAEGPDPMRLRDIAAERLARLPVDFCVQAAEGRRKKLLVADMDSTVVSVECLDELADYAGLKDEIAAITERAMAGDIAFEGALRQRVAKLEGLALEALETVIAERVRLNPGARTLGRTMAANGARCVLVSGGFDVFTERVAAAAGFHAHHANRLLHDGTRLTGEVAEPILGAQAKLEALREEAAALGIGLGEAIAVGDGANDLPMIRAAGLGVAYRGKPKVAAAAAARVDHCDLTALLYFQGYGAETFVA